MTLSVSGIKGKVALVTGASSGLGKHFASLLARNGALVVLAARRADKLESLRATIEQKGGKAIALTMDVTSDISVSEALEEIQSRFDTPSILINNAGMADSKSFLKLDEMSWKRTLDVNLDGAWRVAHQTSQAMVASNQSGCIVNIASILGLRVGFGHTAYAVSKAGLVQLTKSMALELGKKGIRVNALCPGFVETDINRDFFASTQGREYLKQTPAGRAGQLEELDGAMLLLCSDAGSFINGVALPVDGGHLVSSL